MVTMIILLWLEEAKRWQTPEKSSQITGHPLCRLMDCSLKFDIFSVSTTYIHIKQVF